MENTLTPSDLSLHLGEYLRRVSREHERFVVVENGERIAEISPVHEGPKLKDLKRILDELPHLSKDEAEDFARDVEEARRIMNVPTVRDPWAS
ncbi:MAG TPA: type II toxin-antitoxin system prevent-host-death family antitoxin [Candidatus Kapabacteria bacterium]|jgi:prevent-host-death family protein